MAPGAWVRYETAYGDVTVTVTSASAGPALLSS
jgi:hypothetical protein